MDSPSPSGSQTPLSPLFQFEPLTGGNYHDWKFRMQMLLVKLDLWDVVSGGDRRPGSLDEPDVSGGDDVADASALRDAQKAWDARSMKALAEISAHLAELEVVHVRRCRSGKEAWDSLTAIYEPSGLACQVFLSREFNRVRLEEGGDPRHYFAHMIGLVEQLETTGMPVTDDVLAWTLLSGLPASYENIVSALSARKSEITSAMVISTVLQQHLRERQEAAEAPRHPLTLAAPPSAGGRRAQPSSRHSPQHIPPTPRSGIPPTPRTGLHPRRPPDRLDSPFDSDHGTAESPTSAAAMQGHGGNESPYFRKSAWYLQTSATHHISPKRAWFTDYEDIAPPVQLAVAGTPYGAVGCGTLHVAWDTGEGKAHRVVFRNVFYVPDAPASFLSIAQLVERGLGFAFRDGTCLVTQMDGSVAAKAVLESGAYRLLTRKVPPPEPR